MEPISQNGAFEIWLGLRLCFSLFSCVSYFNQNGCARVETVWNQVGCLRIETSTPPWDLKVPSIRIYEPQLDHTGEGTSSGGACCSWDWQASGKPNVISPDGFYLQDEFAWICNYVFVKGVWQKCWICIFHHVSVSWHSMVWFSCHATEWLCERSQANGAMDGLSYLFTPFQTPLKWLHLSNHSSLWFFQIAFDFKCLADMFRKMTLLLMVVYPIFCRIFGWLKYPSKRWWSIPPRPWPPIQCCFGGADAWGGQAGWAGFRLMQKQNWMQKHPKNITKLWIKKNSSREL